MSDINFDDLIPESNVNQTNSLPDATPTGNIDNINFDDLIPNNGGKNGSNNSVSTARSLVTPYSELLRGGLGAGPGVVDFGARIPAWAYNTFRPESVAPVPYPPSLNSSLQNLLTTAGLPEPDASDPVRVLRAAPFGLGGMAATAIGGMANQYNASGNKNINVGGRDTGVSPNDLISGVAGVGSQGGLSPKPFLMSSIKASPDGALAQKLSSTDTPPYLSDAISPGGFWGNVFGYLNNLPGSGRSARASEQQGALNSAAISTMGENSSSLTPEVMQSAENRIGGVFNTFGQNNNISPQAGSQFINDIGNLQNGKWATLGADVQKRLQAQIDNNITPKLNNNYSMDGPDWATLQTGLGKDARSSTDPDYSGALYDLQNATRNAMRQSISPQDWKPFDTANKQYRAMLALEPAAKKALGNGGNIDPTALQSGVSKIYPNYVYNDPNPLPQLAQGSQLLKPQSSTPVTDLYKYGWAGEIPQAAMVLSSPVLGAPLNRMLNTKITPRDFSDPYTSAAGRFMQGGSLPLSLAPQGNQ